MSTEAARIAGMILRAGILVLRPGVAGPVLIVAACLLIAPWLGILVAGLILWLWDVIR